MPVLAAATANGGQRALFEDLKATPTLALHANGTIGTLRMVGRVGCLNTRQKAATEQKGGSNRFVEHSKDAKWFGEGSTNEKRRKERGEICLQGSKFADGNEGRIEPVDEG